MYDYNFLLFYHNKYMIFFSQNSKKRYDNLVRVIDYIEKNIDVLNKHIEDAKKCKSYFAGIDYCRIILIHKNNVKMISFDIDLHKNKKYKFLIKMDENINIHLKKMQKERNKLSADLENSCC